MADNWDQDNAIALGMNVIMIFVKEAKTSEGVAYRDTKRYLWVLSLITPLIPTFWIAVFAVSGNPLWLIGPLVTFYGIIPLLDTIFGEDPHNPPEEIVERLSADPYYRVLLFCSLPLYFLNYYAAAWVIGGHDLPIWIAVIVTLGASAVSGGAITVGHELGHKLNRLDQWGAMLANAFSANGHFRLEHNRGHHTTVATPEDVASAKMGQSVYQFAMREQIGALRRGIAIERDRLAKKGLRFWTWRNELLQGYAITLALWSSVIALWGWKLLPFLILHTYGAIWQLTLANYVEHYGLLREKQDNGRYEPCRPCHSWNTNHIVSNLMLFHLQRHSDHHANPLRPYQALRNFDDLPRLPTGYPGCYVLAVIPPLWYRIMDPKVMVCAKGDLKRVNCVHPIIPSIAPTGT